MEEREINFISPKTWIPNLKKHIEEDHKFEVAENISQQELEALHKKLHED